MSRRTTAFIFIAFIFLMTAAVISAFMSCQHTANAEPDKLPTNPPTESVTHEVPYKTYIIKEYNGFVAVFESDNSRPLKITDCYVSSLPEADRKQLFYGIKTNSENKMKRLLEDLCS